MATYFKDLREFFFIKNNKSDITKIFQTKVSIPSKELNSMICTYLNVLSEI